MGASLIQPSTPNGFSTPHNSMDAKTGCRCVDVDMWNAQGPRDTMNGHRLREVYRKYIGIVFPSINLRFPAVCTCRSTYHTGLRKFADLKQIAGRHL